MSTPAQIASDVLQNPKVACAITGGCGAANLWLWKMQKLGSWVFENINFISGVVGLVMSVTIPVAVYCLQRRKLNREMQIAEEEHAARMRSYKRRVSDR